MAKPLPATSALGNDDPHDDVHDLGCSGDGEDHEQQPDREGRDSEAVGNRGAHAGDDASAAADGANELTSHRDMVTPSSSWPPPNTHQTPSRRRGTHYRIRLL